MKSLLVLSMLFTIGAQAGTLKAVYKNDSAPADMKYIGIFKNKVGNSEYAVTFGKGMSFRNYDLGMFVTYPGGTSAGKDESTILKSTGVEREKLISINLSDLNKKTLFEGQYELYNSVSSKQYALNIDKAVETKFNKYRKMTNPATPADLRAMFRQLEQDYYSYDENENFEFPQFDLQIEFYMNTTAPSQAIASAKVATNGKDAISKLFLSTNNKWFKNNEEASSELLSMLETGTDLDEKVFASYNTKIQYAGLSKRLTNAIQKHLKLEVLEEGGFECEDSFYNWTSATWILKDGSTVSYAPGTECD